MQLTAFTKHAMAHMRTAFILLLVLQAGCVVMKAPGKVVYLKICKGRELSLKIFNCVLYVFKIKIFNIATSKQKNEK